MEIFMSNDVINEETKMVYRMKDAIELRFGKISYSQ